MKKYICVTDPADVGCDMPDQHGEVSSQACIKINNNISDSLGNVKHNEHSVTDVRHLDPGKRQEKCDKTKFYQFVFIRLNSYTVIPVYKGYSREPENVPFMSC